VLQCVAVCCSVLQCVAVCCSVLQCVAVCCIVLQCMLLSYESVSYTKLAKSPRCCQHSPPRLHESRHVWIGGVMSHTIKLRPVHKVAVCCSVLQCVAASRVSESRHMRWTHTYGSGWNRRGVASAPSLYRMTNVTSHVTARHMWISRVMSHNWITSRVSESHLWFHDCITFRVSESYGTDSHIHGVTYSFWVTYSWQRVKAPRCC